MTTYLALSGIVCSPPKPAEPGWQAWQRTPDAPLVVSRARLRALNNGVPGAVSRPHDIQLSFIGTSYDQDDRSPPAGFVAEAVGEAPVWG